MTQLSAVDQKVRDAELAARAALRNHDPDAWSLVHAAWVRRQMARANKADQS